MCASFLWPNSYMMTHREPGDTSTCSGLCYRRGPQAYYIGSKPSCSYPEGKIIFIETGSLSSKATRCTIKNPENIVWNVGSLCSLMCRNHGELLPNNFDINSGLEIIDLGRLSPIYRATFIHLILLGASKYSTFICSSNLDPALFL
jgi:hypothetical protein